MSEPPSEPDGESDSGSMPESAGLPPEIKRTIRQVAENPGISVEPEKLEQALLAFITKTSISYSRRGPLPHPQELAEYEKVLPGSAERIFASSEKQMAHRMGLEARQ